LKAIISDAPQIRDFLRMKAPTAKCSCTNCCGHPRYNSDLYCPYVHTQRNFSKQVHQMELQSRYIDKREKGEQPTADEIAANTFCNEWAIAQSTTLPGLLGVPIPTEDQNALPEIAIPDLFHDFFAGIFQSLVMTLLCLVFALTKIENTVNKTAMGEIDKRTSNLVPKNSYIPNLPHLDWCIYSDGLATIFFKDKGDHSGATGKAGQMRSAWSLNQVIM
jgi:hypothetical protein